MLIVITGLASTSFAADSYFLLNEANLALDAGNPPAAADLFEKYIDSHPATNGTETPLYRKKRQYYIKNLLTAYANLFKIYRDTGNENELISRLNLLKATYDNGTFSLKNIYNLAEIYLDHSRADEAKPLLELIIQQHIANHYPDNIKVALRASSKLIPIYRSKGENVAIESLLASLHENYPDPNFDLNDKYKLATLYLDNGKEKQGTKMLQEIAEEEPFDDSSPFTYTLTGTYAKLLNILHQNHDQAGKDKLLEQFKSVSLEKLAPGNAYKLAVALLNTGEKKQGRKIFDTLANKHPHTVWARKSLFLRAQDAMSEKDWNTAINRFSTYIDRYPEQTFFAAKAYSNLLDAHWSRDGNLEDQQIKINQFADIINGMADYET
ncbi:MAG: tetratricopeptide repeat protein, partial [Desulfobulbaceae bacterium]|nr:tetratricopeptide repeat protein [Desulfobulbaceae bacterium]